MDDHQVSGRENSEVDEFKRVFGWEKEKINRLIEYRKSIIQWQKAINLISKSTIDKIWDRHFADSAQLIDHIPGTARNIVDIGSGAGFPGLVLAIYYTDAPATRITLVESDGRKAAFLRESARRMEIPVDILSTRIESDATVSRLVGVDTVTARAFAPLNRLFSLAAPLFTAETVGVFLKGESVDREIEDALAAWSFDVDLHPSVTDSSGRIAVIRRLKPKTEA